MTKGEENSLLALERLVNEHGIEKTALLLEMTHEQIQEKLRQAASMPA